MMMEARQLLKLERIIAFCPGARDPKVLLERLQPWSWPIKTINDQLNISIRKVTRSEKVKTKKGEMEASFQILVKATEPKALEALEYLWRQFCGLKRAHCVRWSQGGRDEVIQGADGNGGENR